MSKDDINVLLHVEEELNHLWWKWYEENKGNENQPEMKRLNTIMKKLYELMNTDTERI